MKEISRAVRQVYRPKSRGEEIRDSLLPDVDLDESKLELFAQHITALEGIGVNLRSGAFAGYSQCLSR